MMYASSMFTGFRFFLAGFHTQHYLQVKSELVSEGGVVLQDYGPDSTHVVVHDHVVYDDPICDTARRDKKTLVTNLWVEHSLDAGMPVDATNIMYRPVKEQTGIPGANKLLICLTGYQGSDRADIMTMARLMGAPFTKPLLVNKVTHLVCKRFEGEKYELAKKINYTKLVNHRWLEDCLKAWKILPEEPYCISGDELALIAKDSEDETEDTGRNFAGITKLPNEMGETHNQYVMASKVSTPSTHQGFSNNLIFNDGILPKSDLHVESGVVNKLDKQLASGHRAQSQMDAIPDNGDLQNVTFAPSNQLKNGLPSTSRNSEISGGIDAEKFNNLNSSVKTPKKSSIPLCMPVGLGATIAASLKGRLDSDAGNCSPLRSSPRSRASLQTAGKFCKLDERPEEKIADTVRVDMPTFNLETESEEAALVSVGLSNSKKVAESVAGKHSNLNSKKFSRRSSLSKSARKSSNVDVKLEKSLDEKVIANACTSNIGPYQGRAASAYTASSAEAGLFDEKGPGGLLPQKRSADGSNVSYTTPKSQKLTTSASKRVDAAEARTPLNNALEERNINSGSHTGDESPRPSVGRSSPIVSSAKSNSKNSSRSLAFEMVQGSKPINTDALTSTSTKSGCTSPRLGSKKGQSQNLHQDGAPSLGSSDREAVKSGSPKFNSGDQTGDSVAKPARKKMVARKSLGSCPKVSKRSADAQRNSVSTKPLQDDAVIHSAGQKDKKELAPDDNKVLVPLAVDAPVGLSSEPHMESGAEVNDGAELLNEPTGAPHELGVHCEKFVIAEQSRPGETSGVMLYQTDGADNKNGQCMPVIETVDTKKNLVPQKKGLAVKAKKKTPLAVKGAGKNADEVDGGQSSDSVKEQVVGDAAKKRRGTLLLNKSKRLVEVEKEDVLVCDDQVAVVRENELVSNDQHTNKSVKHAGKLSLEKRRGTLLTNKSKGPVEAETENEQNFDDDGGQNNSEKCPGELAATSNMTQDDKEAKNKIDPGAHKGQVTGKAAKCPKLAGKKRRGTILLKKPDVPDGAEKENEPVLDGKQDPVKLAGASVILDGSKDAEKENIHILGNNQGKSKSGKRVGSLAGKKRRGTLVLSKSEAQVDEENKNKPVRDDDEGKIKDGILTEKLNFNLTDSDAANSDSLDIHELKEVKKQPGCFILSGHRLQRKEFQLLIKRLKGRVCRDSHQWSYQASHFIVPDPIRRTEKFFAAAASGSWILKTDYLTASSQAGKFLPEEPYEWHKNSLSEDGAISLEAPRKWRLLRERTGHGAFYGMQIVIYGECIAPPLDTLKRAVKAGDGTILATSPPYTRFLESRVDFAIISPGMPRVDIWVQEFLRHEIPCVLADYLVEYVCKPGYPLDRHVQYNTHEWAAKSFSKLTSLSEEVIADVATPSNDQVSIDLACQVCGSTDRGEVMLVCGNETGSIGCGIGTHIDCCDPPLEDIPEEDWFCPKCTEPKNKHHRSSKKKTSTNRS